MKGQMFIVTVIFLVGLIFSVQQVVLQYSSVSMQNAMTKNDFFVIENIKNAVNETAGRAQGCQEMEDRLSELRGFLENSLITSEYSIAIAYNLSCNWPSYNISLAVHSVGQNIETWARFLLLGSGAAVITPAPLTVSWIPPTAANGTETANKTYITWNISVNDNVWLARIQINGTNQTATCVNATVNSYCYYNETGITGNYTRCAVGWTSNGTSTWNHTRTQTICRSTNEQQPVPPPSPRVTVDLFDPLFYKKVAQNAFFPFIVNVTCWDAYCGGVNVTLYEKFVKFYQEDADEVGGGLNDAGWDCSYCPVDGSWGTGGNGCGFAVDGANTAFFVNYTKPPGAEQNSTRWMVEYSTTWTPGNPNPNYIVDNLTIPLSCWNYDGSKLILKGESQTIAGFAVVWSCFDGAWEVIKHIDTSARNICEEAMLWGFSDYPGRPVPEGPVKTLNSGNDTADIMFSVLSCGGPPLHCAGSQMKWNIADIPASSTINQGLLCLWDTDDEIHDGVTVNYVSNQTWDENIGVAGINAMTLLNQTNVTLSSTAIGWKCLDVTTQLQQSYANGNKNFTVRFWDQLWSVTVADTVADNAGLNVGNTGTPYGGLFEDREGSRGTANYPYLNVTYTPKPFYTNITNPVTINLAKGESRNVLFWVNPTGHVGEFYNFSATANLTSNPAINDTTDNAEIEIGSPI